MVKKFILLLVGVPIYANLDYQIIESNGEVEYRIYTNDERSNSCHEACIRHAYRRPRSIHIEKNPDFLREGAPFSHRKHICHCYY